jgi:putative PIN family toxin of toxin-antitoxin system
MPMRPLVLDTNVVLDLLVFGDPRTQGLRSALDAQQVQWLATPAMRDELAHVLAYPNFVRRVPDAGLVLDAFDRQVRCVEAAPPSKVICRDEDDQKFIDLAVAHAGVLISKDNEVLRLKKKLAPLNVLTAPMYSCS